MSWQRQKEEHSGLAIFSKDAVEIQICLTKFHLPYIFIQLFHILLEVVSIL